MQHTNSLDNLQHPTLWLSASSCICSLSCATHSKNGRAVKRSLRQGMASSAVRKASVPLSWRGRWNASVLGGSPRRGPAHRLGLGGDGCGECFQGFKLFQSLCGNTAIGTGTTPGPSLSTRVSVVTGGGASSATFGGGWRWYGNTSVCDGDYTNGAELINSIFACSAEIVRLLRVSKRWKWGILLWPLPHLRCVATAGGSTSVRTCGMPHQLAGHTPIGLKEHQYHTTHHTPHHTHHTVLTVPSRPYKLASTVGQAQKTGPQSTQNQYALTS